jgi:O-antigen/teichoic acid export membrane protein
VPRDRAARGVPRRLGSSSLAEDARLHARGPLTGTPEEPAAEGVGARAASGAVLLGARGLVVYTLGIGANLLLARLLDPRDFGVVALGTVVVVMSTYLSTGGLSAALIQRERPPERRELEAVQGLQLAVTGAVAVIVAAVCAPLGTEALVVATMVAAVPLTMLRTPSVVVLERDLRYRVIATADLVEAMTYYVWSVGTVLLGWGVWGMATAVVARAAAGSAVAVGYAPMGFVRPRWSWPDVRPLFAFGAKFQAATLLQIGREQAVAVAVAAVAGLSTLGVWNLAWRVIQVPLLLFQTVGRVAFPALSRMMDAGRDPRAAIERAAAGLAALTAVVTVALVALAPALPSVVGRGWEDVPDVLVWAGVALLTNAPTVVVAGGYLYAADDAGAVATATLLSAIVWVGLASALLPALDAPAVGIGWVAGGLLNAALLRRRTTARTGAALLRSIGPPTCVGLVALAAAALVARAIDDALLGAAAGLAAGEALALAGLAVAARPALGDLLALGGQSVRALGRPGAA